MWESDRIELQNFKKNSDKIKCINCKSIDMFYDKSYLICKLCMTIQDEHSNISDFGMYEDPNDIINKLYPYTNSSTSIIVNFKKVPHGMLLCKMHGWTAITHCERKLKRINDIIIDICKDKHIGSLELSDATILNNTLYKFKIINMYYKFRHPTTNGILAMCYYYAWKDRNIILSTTELLNIFDIKQSILSRGNKKINKILTEYSIKSDIFNTRPIQIMNYISNIEYKFEFSKKDILNITHILMRLKNNIISIINIPKSIISGVIYNYVKFHNIDISKNEIMIKCGVSSSVIDTYAFKTYPFIHCI